MPLELKFIIWKLQISLTALVFYSSLVGAAIIAVLTLPKFVRNYLKVKALNKELNGSKKRIVELEKQKIEKIEKN